MPGERVLRPRNRKAAETPAKKMLEKKSEADVLATKVLRMEMLLSSALTRLDSLKVKSEKGEAIVAPPPNTKIVGINVGGTVFSTTRETLGRFRPSYLASIVSGDFGVTLDADGNIFLDRSPRYFEKILNYLRDPTAPQDWDFDDLGLVHELEFFGIKKHLHKGSIYVANGFNGTGRLGTIEKYDLWTRRWRTVHELGTRMSSVAATAHNRKMYLAGGKTSLNRAASLVTCFDPVLGSLALMPSLKDARFGLGLVTLDDAIYAVGGYCDDGGRLDSVEMYNFEKKKWSIMGSLSESRSAFGCAVLNGKIYAGGGYVGSADMSTPSESVEIYDPETNLWTKAPSLSVPRAHLSFVVFQGTLWAIGGFDGTRTSCVTETLDLKKKKWIGGPDLHKSRSVTACAELEGRLHVIGGYDEKVYLKSVEAYDPELGMWIPAPDMMVPRGRHCCVTLDY